MRGLNLPRRTGGTRGNRDTFEVEADDGGLRPHPGNRKKRGIRQTRHVAGEHNCPRRLPQAVFKPIPQVFEANRVILEGIHGGLRRRSEPRNTRNILRSGPAPQFLTAAAQQRLKSPHPLGQNHGAHAFRSANLMPGNRDQISIQAIDIKINLSKCLDCVDMQEAASLMGTYMEGANAALNDGNAAQAKSFMDKAERQIEKLEKFLNR